MYGSIYMISIESAVEGFVLLVDGRRVLAHSRRAPCVEIGAAENLVKRGKTSYKLRSRRVVRSPLRSFKITESSEDFVVVDFDGRLSMALRLQDGLLRLSFSRFDSSVNFFRLRLAAWPDEAIFGCGERFERMDLKGRRLSFWVQDRGMGRLPAVSGAACGSGEERGATPFPVPSFVSTKNYWCTLDCSAYTIFDFRRATTLVESWAVPRELVLGWGGDAPSVVAGLGGFCGKAPPLPSWVFDGAWLEVRGGIGELRRRLATALSAGVKVGAVWARDWCGPTSPGPGARAMRELVYDATLYPDLPSEIASLRARGIRFIGYATPFLDPAGGLYAEASSAGRCVKDAEGKEYMVSLRSSPVALLDLTNREAYARFKDALKRGMLGIGMSGWLADSGEYLPADAVLASGENAASAHNRWPRIWARIGREAIDESSTDAVLLARSGWLGSARYVNAFWSSEGLESFSTRDGFPSSVPAALSLGLSGGGSWHAEAGSPLSYAWSGKRAERLARWAEMSAFSPILRMGDGLRPEASDRFWADPESLGLFARMSEIYAALKPYHVAVASEQVETGLPPMRHPWIHYEADPQVRRLSYQYLYGRDLMVAPALAPRAALTDLYLPDDEWVHLWSSRLFRGGRVSVESPLGYPAVFYRASSPFASLFDALRRTAKRI